MQIRQLFGFCGAVIGLNRVGDQQQYMLIEYTYPTVWPSLLSAALLWATTDISAVQLVFCSLET